MRDTFDRSLVNAAMAKEIQNVISGTLTLTAGVGAAKGINYSRAVINKQESVIIIKP